MSAPIWSKEQIEAMDLRNARRQRLKDTVKSCEAYMNWYYNEPHPTDEDTPVSFMHFSAAMGDFNLLYPEEVPDFRCNYRDAERIDMIIAVRDKAQDELNKDF